MGDIIKIAEQYGEFVMLEDGFWYYWPRIDNGGISEYDLYLLWQELKRRNKKWKEDIDEYFRSGLGSDQVGSDDGRQACGQDDFGDGTASFDGPSDT